jgi:hypothetical protein
MLVPVTKLARVEQLVLHQVARLHVERAEGLVHQEHARPVDERRGQRHALAHAPGELVRVVALEALQAHAAHPLDRPLAGRGGRRAADRQRQRDVLDRGLPGQERVALEQIADVGRHPARHRAVGACDAPLGDGHQAGDRAEQGVLPQPEGPTRLTKRPGPTVKLTSRTAVNAPVGVSNVLVARSTTIIAGSRQLRSAARVGRGSARCRR